MAVHNVVNRIHFCGFQDEIPKFTTRMAVKWQERGETAQYNFGDECFIDSADLWWEINP